MKRTLLLVLLSASALFADKSWPSVPFATVRAYAWPGDHEHLNAILPGMKLAPGAINKEGALLTPEQLHRLRVAVSPPQHSRGGQTIPVSNCYIPHNAFVFYDAAKTPVAYLEVCFSCLGYTAQPRIPAAVSNYLSLAAIFEELKLPMGPYVTAKAFGKANLRELQTAD
jgi:hypothetical protein